MKSVPASFTPLLALLAFAAGCSAADATQTTGTANGKAFTPAVAISSDVLADGAPGGAVWISTEAATCDLIGGHQRAPKASTLVIFFSQQAAGGGAGPVTQGTFTVIAPYDTASGDRIATAVFGDTDASCKTTSSLSAKSGTVVIDSVEGGAYSGKADLVFTTGETLSVTFGAAACPGLGSSYAWGGTPTCG